MEKSNHLDCLIKGESLLHVESVFLIGHGAKYAYQIYPQKWSSMSWHEEGEKRKLLFSAL